MTGAKFRILLWLKTPDDFTHHMQGESLAMISSRHGLRQPAVFWTAFIDFRGPLEKDGFWTAVYYIDSFWTAY